MATDRDEEAVPLLKKKQEDKKNSWVKWVVIMTIAGAWFGTGVWVGCQKEGWYFVTSLYVMVQIVTTIGYGDISIADDSTKIWVAIYVLIGVMILAGMVSNCMADILTKQEDVLKRQMKRVEARITGVEPHQSETRQAVNKVIVTFILFAAFIAAGTIFYAVYEDCTCSYGETAIEGCVEGPKCPETGGAVKTWIDTFYMSVVTLTTVGFGDHSPKSYYGRWFGIFWMLLGVVATGNFIGAFSEFFLAAEKDRRHLDRIDEDVFATVDTDKDGSLSRSEFRSFAFLKFEMVHQWDLDKIDQIFAGMDEDKNGYLTYEECQHYFQCLEQ